MRKSNIRTQDWTLYKQKNIYLLERMNKTLWYYGWKYAYILFCFLSIPKREIVDTTWLYKYFVNDVNLADYWGDAIKPSG